MSAGFLLDASILSLTAPGRMAWDDVITWLRAHDDHLHISAVTIAEVEQGIGKLRRSGATHRAGLLAQWLDAILAERSDRILAFDGRTGRIAGALSDQAMAAGRHPGFADVAIAATALAHDLMVLTRNVRHFAALSVPFADPLDHLPLPPDRPTR